MTALLSYVYSVLVGVLLAGVAIGSGWALWSLWELVQKGNGE